MQSCIVSSQTAVKPSRQSTVRAPLAQSARLVNTCGASVRASTQQQRLVCYATAAAPQPTAESVETGPETWYAVIANADFMLNDVQNEPFAEQLRERVRFLKESGKPRDFYLVCDPAWLDEKFPEDAKKVGRPCIALVSTDKVWITFMKLRLDRVLKLQVDNMTMSEVTKCTSKVPEFPKPEVWTAPYAKYAPGWWDVFMPGKLDN